MVNIFLILKAYEKIILFFWQIIRADIIEDAGDSLSPLIDIGQIEGAFIMGLGWWLTEELVYDTSNGALLTDNTWVRKHL